MANKPLQETACTDASKKKWTKDNVVMVSGEVTVIGATKDDMTSKDDEAGFACVSPDSAAGVFDKDDLSVVTEDHARVRECRN